MPRFEYVRISLAQITTGPLFDGVPERRTIPQRGDILRAIFAVRRDFIHHSKKFSFVPMDAPDGYVAGFFGRAVKVRGKSGPDKKYATEIIETNDSALFLLQMAEDSQIAAMEHKQAVGSPKGIIEALLQSLHNLDGFRDYAPHVQYISSEETYWAAVNENKGTITNITFTFIPPNALKSRETVMIFIADAAKYANVDTLKHTYESKVGAINPEADILAGSADVALKGGGEATVRVGRKVVFSSSQSRKVVDIPNEEVPESSEQSSIVMDIIRKIFGKL